MKRWSCVVAVYAGLSCAPAQAQAAGGTGSPAPVPATASSPYSPPSGAELARFEAALGSGDRRETAEILDELAGRWLESNRALRPNPLLSGLAGRFHAAMGQPAFALAYLRVADAADVPDPQRSAALIALVEAESAAGRPDAAALASRRAEAVIPDGPMRARLELARARSMLVIDPRAALARLRDLAATTDLELRFEALLALSRAHGLLGEDAAAAEAGERAWTASAGRPLSVRGPTRAALVLAGLAARRGDEDRLLAMLTTAGAAGASLNPDLGELLPLCGTSGIRPDDYVMFAVNTRGDHWSELLEPVTSSRSAIVRPFFEALAGRRILAQGDGGAAALVFTARCRSTPAAKYIPPLVEGPWADWLAAHGIFGIFEPGLELDDIAALSARVGRLESDDQDDPRLIGPRFDLATRLALRAHAVGDADIRVAMRLRDQAVAGMRRAGAGEDTLAIETIRAVIERGRADGSDWGNVRPELARAISALPIDLAYIHGTMWMLSDPTIEDEMALPFVRGLLARLPREMDPRRRALTVKLTELQLAAGDVRAARATGRSAGIAETDCRLLPEPPVTVSAQISNDDYPRLATETGMTGLSLLDFSIGSDGKVADARLVLSAPSGLFDRTVERAASTFRYGPGDGGNTLRPCSGRLQRIVWRLPSGDDDDIAPLAPLPLDPGLT